MPGPTLRVRPLLVPALLMTLAACPPAPPDTTADLEALAALRTAFQAAENTGDADAVVQTLAADVILMAPNRPAIEGADAVGAHFEAQFEQVTLALDYRSLEAVVTGDWAFDRGTYEATVTPKLGGEASTSRGKYLWVARRGTDGGWRYARITWNGDGGG
ncbi:MAG: DUF4440 domain-containing protein [Gemmatimonadales bacterium]|nr:DUF4440 domain-containing protein [Gemmatimonadales bacterium]